MPESISSAAAAACSRNKPLAAAQEPDETTPLTSGIAREPPQEQWRFSWPLAAFSIFVIETVMISIGTNLINVTAVGFYKSIIVCSEPGMNCKKGLIYDESPGQDVEEILGAARFEYTIIQAITAMLALAWCIPVALHMCKLRTVLIAAQCSAVMIEIVQAYIYYQSGSLTIPWLLATPCLSIFLGGGGMTYMVLRDCVLLETYGNERFLPRRVGLEAVGNLAGFVGLLVSKPIMDKCGSWPCLCLGLLASILGCSTLLILPALREVEKAKTFRDAIDVVDKRTLLVIAACSMPSAFFSTAADVYTLQYVPLQFGEKSVGVVLAPARFISAIIGALAQLYRHELSTNRQFAFVASLLLVQSISGAFLGLSNTIATFAASLAFASLATLLPSFIRNLLSSFSKPVHRTGIFGADQAVTLLTMAASGFAMNGTFSLGMHQDTKRPEWPYFASSLLSVVALIVVIALWAYQMSEGSHIDDTRSVDVQNPGDALRSRHLQASDSSGLEGAQN